MVQENPFVITGAIPHRLFCDREAESRRLIGAVTGGNNVTLIAERRIGKSKLIDFCYSSPEIEGHYYTFYIDLFHTSSLQELVYEFGKAVFAELRKTDIAVLRKFISALKSIKADFTYNAVSGEPQFSLSLGDIQNPQFSLEEIFSALENADRHCIVAFDEFQQVAYYPEKNIEALLRSHIQRMSNTNFVFAGSERHTISEMFLASARPFYCSTEIMELHPIPLDSYTAFVKRLLDMVGKTIDDNDVEYVYRLVFGNTYCMQRIYHDMAFLPIAGGKCSRPIIDRTIDNIIMGAADSYNLLIARLSVRQKELLYAIAREGKAEKLQSGEFIKRHSLQSAAAVQSALRKLIEINFVTTDGRYYYLQDRFMQMYLSLH